MRKHSTRLKKRSKIKKSERKIIKKTTKKLVVRPKTKKIIKVPSSNITIVATSDDINSNSKKSGAVKRKLLDKNDKYEEDEIEKS